MDIISAVVSFICILIPFSFGFFLGYKEGMKTMKRIDDNIIEEAKRCIYGEEYEKGRKDVETQFCSYDACKNRQEEYQRGLTDAWEAARFIADMPYGEEEKAFGSGGWAFIVKHTASEAIEKIRQYEQEKEEIKVGDEVIPRETEYDDMIVTRLWKDDYDSDCIDAIGFDGRISSFLVSRVSKTGKHYEIATVLEKMRGEQDG